jgi:cytidylate kinase
VGSRVAVLIGWPFVDTGTMYRAITWLALQRGTDLADATGLGHIASQAKMQVLPPAPGDKEYATVIVDGQDATPYLRTPPVEQAVSTISAVPEVRRSMVELQRSLVAHHPVVMAGRDIGTVVLPDARLKLYLEASPERRAERRAAELARRGLARTFGDVLTETLERDRLDSGRADSPLRPAADAIIIHTDSLNEDEVVARILDLARSALGVKV